MRLSRTRALGAALAIIAGFGIASAQTDARGVPSPGAAAPTGEEANLSPEQQLAESREYLRGMENGSGTVRRQLEQARAARDVVKVLCLNDKLNQIDIAARTARDRLNNLEEAVSQRDTERGHHEFTVLRVLRDRVNALVSEANQCIGEEAAFIGESEVTVNIDPTIPPVDPGKLGFDPGPGIILDSPILSSPVE